MKPVGIYDIVRIDEFSATPKYQQLINCVLKGIEHGRLKQHDVLPSINDLSYELDVSRDTGNLTSEVCWKIRGLLWKYFEIAKIFLSEYL